MIELTCIECPNGCAMTVDNSENEIKVTGNRCKRGVSFAVSELTNPMRTICSTVKTAFDFCPVLPVRVSGEIPKDKIFEVMAVINKTTVKNKVRRGDIIIPDVLNLGVDIIATSDILST
ncbi:MAG: DUF1667 domain-containing protein [Clostridiales bacterium]|nr:DUF1667 domain-containing protein [Clostridiales bacterium]MCD7827542.1 DUF1667 domain-containing protein [Clostridiales bacterium]